MCHIQHGIQKQTWRQSSFEAFIYTKQLGMYLFYLYWAISILKTAMAWWERSRYMRISFNDCFNKTYGRQRKLAKDIFSKMLHRSCTTMLKLCKLISYNFITCQWIMWAPNRILMMGVTSFFFFFPVLLACFLLCTP